MRVEFTESEIRIYDDDEAELVGWTEQEWIEDPQVVFSIANAVMLSVTDPAELRAKLEVANDAS